MRLRMILMRNLIALRKLVHTRITSAKVIGLGKQKTKPLFRILDRDQAFGCTKRVPKRASAPTSTRVRASVET